MVLRAKTIEYGFTSVTASVASFVYGIHPNELIVIPETTNRTFQSVFLYHFAQQNVGAAASVTSVSSSIRLFGPANAVQKTVVTASARNASGECISGNWIHDVTDYFRTNFSSSFTAMSATLSGGMNPGPFANLSSKLIITYTFEDSTLTGSNKAIKTVRIPQEGNNGNLTTAFSASNTIPALATFCPESNKTFRNIFLEIEGQDGVTAASAPDPVLTMSLGNASLFNYNFGITDTLITSQYSTRIWDLTDIINVSQSYWLSASTTNTNTPWPCLSTHLVATYEYEPSTTTSILNSLLIPVLDEPGFIGGNTTALKTRFSRTFPIVDADPIMFTSSAVKLYYSDGAAMAVDFRVGSQSSRTFSHAATVRAGSMVIQRRIDDGAIGGAGMTLARGLNTITLDVFRTGTAFGSLGSNLNGVLFLNYTSSVNPEGIESHPKTILALLQETPPTLNPTLVTVSSSGRMPIIPESGSFYYLYSGGTYLPINMGNTGHMDTFLTLHGSVEANEADGAGWQALYVGTQTGDSETGVYPVYTFSPDVWKRFPNKIDGTNTLLNYTQMRQWRLASAPTSEVVLHGWHVTTYHSRMFTKTGSVYPNPGAGQVVKVFRNDTGELVTTASTDANGRYSFAYHNDTIDLYSETRVNDYLTGRSGLFRVS